MNIKLDPAVVMRGLVARLLYIPTRKEEIGVIVLCHMGVGLSIGRRAWGVENCPGGGGGVPPPRPPTKSPLPPYLAYRIQNIPPPSLFFVSRIHNTEHLIIKYNIQHTPPTKQQYTVCIVHNTQAIVHATNNKTA